MDNKAKIIAILAIGLLLPILLMAIMATPADAAEVAPPVGGWTLESSISVDAAEVYGAETVMDYQFGATNAGGESIELMISAIDRTKNHTYIWCDIDYSVAPKGYVYVSQMVEVEQGGNRIGHFVVGLQCNAAGKMYPRIGSYLKDAEGNYIEDFQYFDPVGDDVAQMAVQVSITNLHGYLGAAQWQIDMRLYQFSVGGDGMLDFARVDRRVMIMDDGVFPVDVSTKTIKAITAGQFMADVAASLPDIVAARNYGVRQAREEYNAGYSAGNAAGYESGHDDGFQSGLIEGTHQGRQQGYDECAEEVKESKSAIWDIMSMPFNLLAGILNFEVFGVNVFGAVTAVMTVALVIFVLKKVGVF